MLRPFFAAVGLWLSALPAMAGPEAVVTFNEVQYHPTATQPEGEWIELRNQHGVNVDLSGWRLDGGADFVFPAGTTIPAGGYLVIAADPGAFTAAKGLAAAGPFTGALANSGEQVTLKNKNGRLMDSIDFRDRFPWPDAGDGSGATLAKGNETAASEDPKSWRASIFTGGTPGAANATVPGNPPAPLYAQRYYSFEGTAQDASPNALHGALIDGATFSTSTPAALGAGQSLSTDGVNDMVEVMDSVIPSAYTVAGWVKADVIRAQSIFVRTSPSGPTAYWKHQLRMTAAGKFEHYTYDGAARVVTGTTTAVANTWYHVAITAQGSGPMRLYVNGVEEGTSVNVGSLGTGETRWLFGSNSGNAMNWFDGRMDDVAIWHATLGAAAIQSLASGATRPTVQPDSSSVPSEEVPLAINELTAAGALSSWIELRNYGSSALAIGGYIVARENGDQFTIPAQSLAASGLVTFSSGALGFRPENNERLFLYNPGKVKVLDAVRVKTRHQARRTTGQGLPPGELLETEKASEKTPGAVNNVALESGVVIHEIMYHHRPQYRDGATPFSEDPEQWIELHNRSGAVVDLAGWQLDDAVGFTFPAGSRLAAGGYLVIANDPAAFNAGHPGVTAAGPFSGHLSNDGERIALRDALGNVVDEMAYGDHRPWPLFADAGGSSLELRDPSADNSSPEAWAASDESSRSGWQNYTFTLTAVTPTHTAPVNGFHELRLGLLDSGEVLLDDVSVIEDPGGLNRELVQNGSFTGGTGAWRLLGNHETSGVISDGGGNVLEVVANSAANYHPNGLETSLKAGGALVPVVDGRSYRVSFRAKWLRGSPQLHCELYYNKLAKTVILAQPGQGGTPGAANSTRVANLGPTFSDVRHSPVIPAANVPVTVSARADDPQGITSVSLKYSVNGSSFITVTMALGADGRWTGIIPGMSASAIAQFYLEGRDSTSTTATWPAAGPASRALIQVQDGRAAAGRQSLRMIMSAADANLMYSSIDMMNQRRRGCTLVSNESEVFYDAEMRLHGSMFTRATPSNASFNLYFPSDHRFRGVVEKAVFRVSGRNEIVIKHLINTAGGIPENHDDIAWMVGPVYSGGAIGTGPARLELTQFDANYFDDQAADGTEGSVFKMEGIRVYQSTTDGNPESRKDPQPSKIGWVSTFDLTDEGDGGAKPELYRHNLKITSNRAGDDYGKIVQMCQAFSQPAGPALDAQVEAAIDVDEWMRVLALESLCGIGDAYGFPDSSFPNGSPHNFNFYSPPGTGKVVAVPWDWNFVFNHATNYPLLPGAMAISKIAARPKFSRLFYGHVRHLCQTAFSSSAMTPWIAHYASATGDSYSSYAGYISARASFAMGQLPAQVPFNITTNGGNPVSTNAPTVELEGDGWIDVREIRLQGSQVPLPLTWIDGDTWRVIVPVAGGTNPVTLAAYNHDGVAVGTDSITITGVGGIVPASSANLVVSELMYRPGTGGSEFIELMNIGVQAIDLTGCTFSDGIEFNFANGTTLPAAARLVISQGQFLNGTAFNNGGERVTITGPSGQIRSFVYDNVTPWPTAADGLGASLVLIAPRANPDPNLPGSWRASSEIGGNPGTTDAPAFPNDLAADGDGDGVSALLEYGFGTSDAVPGSAPIAMDPGGRTWTVEHSTVADEAILAAETSSDLSTWRSDAGAITRLSTEAISPTRSRTTWQLGPDLASGPGAFFRVRVTPRP